MTNLLWVSGRKPDERPPLEWILNGMPNLANQNEWFPKSVGLISLHEEPIKKVSIPKNLEFKMS